MVMSHMNKGFILLDSLLSVFIVSYICILCFSIYKSIIIYEDSYLLYQEKSNIHLDYIFSNYIYCEPCILDESD